jgi:23S rRNA (cytidine1920-2'-O)/16S rRNA (cytidine1409-2'-O)-methyltransferase
LAPTRSRARDLIAGGHVTIGETIAVKAGQFVTEADRLTIAAAGGADYVSRGALKLIAALDAFSFDPDGRVCLDIGASTGGFTEVLLMRGATCVHAVDVGRDQLHPRLAADPRVVRHDRVDARDLADVAPQARFDAIVVDVSFISLVKMLAPALARAAPGAWLVTLVKPQFEAGRRSVGKGGIVRDPVARRAANDAVKVWVAQHGGWSFVGEVPSPIAGADGNIETLMAWVRRD